MEINQASDRLSYLVNSIPSLISKIPDEEFGKPGSRKMERKTDPGPY